ncbi:hypothetical protein ACS0TY_004477 [Phlomoides rotata]
MKEEEEIVEEFEEEHEHKEIDGENEEDPEEEDIDGENEEDSEEEIDGETEEDPEEEIVEEPEEDPEEEIGGETEEDPEEEIVEEPEEDPEEEINEEAGEESLAVEDSHLSSVMSGGINSKGTGNEPCENPEEKRGSKVAEESSGKCRKSRWDLKQEGETREIDGNKRQKTRWDNNSQNSLIKQSGCIDPLELLRDPETIKLRDKLMMINKKLQSSEINAEGHKLIIEKNHILSSLAQSSLSFQSPAKLVTKVLIPEKEYPSYNFVGLILGPKGNTQKKMEKETGAKILLRGKGSGDAKSENEDLHVRVEASNRQSLNAAEVMIKKLLVPVADLNNDHKRAQLMELAKLRGTYKDKIVCDLCKEQGHRKYACPLAESTFKAVCCDVCGSFGHLASSCNVSKGKSNKEVDYANLYVGYLPHEIDDKRLKELFVPYGKITNTVVIKDQTTGLSKGYGFVKFENPEDAGAAIKYMNGYKMGGKMLAVRVAGQRPIVAPLHPAQVLPVPFNIVGQYGSMFSDAVYSTLNNESSSFALSSGQNATSQTDLRLTGYLSSSGQGFPARIPTDSVSYQFPGDPEYRGSQLMSFVSGIEMNATQDWMPESAKNSTYFPSSGSS